MWQVIYYDCAVLNLKCECHGETKEEDVVACELGSSSWTRKKWRWWIMRDSKTLQYVPVEMVRRHVEGKGNFIAGLDHPLVLTKEEEAHFSWASGSKGRYGVWFDPKWCNGDGICNSWKGQMQTSIHRWSCQTSVVWGGSWHTIRSLVFLLESQALSYCHASSSKKDNRRFFVKLGSLYGRLNLISKPSQIYNATMIHKLSKVIAEPHLVGTPTLPGPSEAPQGWGGW